MSIPSLTFFSVGAMACSGNSNSSECIFFRSLSSGCVPNIGLTASAEYKQINSNSCSKFKEYLTVLKETSSKYSSSTLKLSHFIISAIIERETLWGNLNVGFGSGCNMKGDGGNGWGIAQMDIGANPLLATEGVGVKTTKKYGSEKFKYDSCIESVKYVGAFLMNIEDNFKDALKNKISSAGINTQESSNGFNDQKAQKAYMQLIINTYNAGAGGVTREGSRCRVNRDGSVVEACTTPKTKGSPNRIVYYGEDVLETAEDFFECENNRRPNNNEVLTANPTSDNLKSLKECLNKIRDSKNSFINIPGNYNFSNELKEFIQKNRGLQTDPNGTYYGQCVSLSKQWQSYIGASFSAWLAKGVDPNYTGPVQKYNAIKGGDLSGFQENEKYKIVLIEDKNSLEPGDVILMKSTSPYGHTGILTSHDSTNFKIFDQWLGETVGGANGLPMERSYSKSLFLIAVRYIKK
ncbi:MAG: hypothetical protein ACRCXZ_08925 [Patescibacteria group bacterium]